MAKKKAQKEQREFSVGDRVTWSSQAAGSWKTKTGTIVEVGTVGQWMKNTHRLATARHRYAVEVETKHSRGARKDLYFPSTSALSLVYGKTA